MKIVGGNPQNTTATWTTRDTIVLILIILVSGVVGLYFGIVAAIATFVALSGVFLPKPPTLNSWMPERTLPPQPRQKRRKRRS